ncbi:MAG: type II toxin-antitoxin system RelE/ParE family toxin [Burkholderiaceae bacterium]
MAASEDATGLAQVRFTANFEANLASIEAFWLQNEYPVGYGRLLDALSDTVIANLERHPRLGRSFFGRVAESAEALGLVQKLHARFAGYDAGADVREYVMDHYLVLYAVIDQKHPKAPVLYLLAIKHHKQLSFDFEHLGLNR